MSGFTHRWNESAAEREARGRGRGSAEHRRRRKAFLLSVYGDGAKAPCRWCGAKLDKATLTADRYPVAGIDGGTYRRGNIVPACRTCNEQGVGRKRLLKVLASFLRIG